MESAKFDQIKELMSHMAESGVTEIFIEDGDGRLAISRLQDGLRGLSYNPCGPDMPGGVRIVHGIGAGKADYETGRAGADAAAEGDIKNAEAKNAPVAVLPERRAVKHGGYAVKSPIVGTFYASSSPASPPFVSVGGKVKKGDVLCIIEAMKVMNEITSDVGGTVLEIRAENEQMVEYGQILFMISEGD